MKNSPHFMHGGGGLKQQQRHEMVSEMEISQQQQYAASPYSQSPYSMGMEHQQMGSPQHQMAPPQSNESAASYHQANAPSPANNSPATQVAAKKRGRKKKVKEEPVPVVEPQIPTTPIR